MVKKNADRANPAQAVLAWSDFSPPLHGDLFLKVE
jgi:hypothetical protein